MNEAQAIVNEINRQEQKKRSESEQYTLGQVISLLESLPSDHLVEVEIEDLYFGLANPHSYRGYYCDLSIEAVNGISTVQEMLKVFKECMGKTFTGYKGGDFMMGDTTPLWISSYGDAENIAIVGWKQNPTDPGIIFTTIKKDF